MYIKLYLIEVSCMSNINQLCYLIYHLFYIIYFHTDYFYALILFFFKFYSSIT